MSSYVIRARATAGVRARPKTLKLVYKMETLVKSLEEKVSNFEKSLKTILPIFLGLQEKVNKGEKDLTKLRNSFLRRNKVRVRYVVNKVININF